MNRKSPHFWDAAHLDVGMEFHWPKVAREILHHLCRKHRRMSHEMPCVLADSQCSLRIRSMAVGSNMVWFISSIWRNTTPVSWAFKLWGSHKMMLSKVFKSLKDISWRPLRHQQLATTCRPLLEYPRSDSRPEWWRISFGCLPLKGSSRKKKEDSRVPVLDI